MSINLKVYDNGDHTCLVWLPGDGNPIADCRGYTIRRVSKGIETYLHGFVGFSDDDTFDSKSPWKFPLQRFMWWDYGVKPGDVVQYAVIPVVGSDKDHLKLSVANGSELTAPLTITGQTSPHISAYFNKGIVSAQWVARSLARQPKDAKLADLIGTPGNQLRNELSGLLRLQLLALLDDAKKHHTEVYAALYELNDPELIDGLVALGKKCHLILANGAFKPPTNDENAGVRKQLRSKVDLHDRLVTSGHFAHNKFVVFCNPSGQPQTVLTGSTNWTKTGLCTQANNGVIVDDADLAKCFVDEWNLLKSAGSDYPKSLAVANSKQQSFKVDGCRVTQWFAPTSDAEDLEYARQLIKSAKDGILFLFFNPGAFVSPDAPKKWTLLQNILVRDVAGSPDYDPGLYMRGVVNQEIAGLTGPGAASAGSTRHAILDPSAVANPVTLFKGGDQPPQRLTYEAMVPKNIKTKFHNWQSEVLGAGVHIHSKVIVLDPFGKNPVVMTGSHNLGYKASSKNDDNLMIVEGNAGLAAAYAINIIAIYQTYRWNSYVEAHRQDPRVWYGLVDSDQWQKNYLSGRQLEELKFWFGNSPASPALATTVIRFATTPPRKHASVKKKAATPVIKQVLKKKPPVARKKKTPKKKS